MSKSIEIVRTQDENLVEQALEIRKQVFVIEQNVPEEEEYDQFDKDAVHFIAYIEKNPAGTARYRETAEGIKLERFAVLPDYRKNGIATAILQEILQEVSNTGKNIYLHAQLPVVKLYEKAGFQTVGEQFTEAGIEHFKMRM